MATGDERSRWFRHLGRILTVILATNGTLLVSGRSYRGAVILTDTTAAFDPQPPLPNQHIIGISKRPACTDMPAIMACYQGGLRRHPDLSLVYYTPSTTMRDVHQKRPARDVRAVSSYCVHDAMLG
jgi:hypothetical protein